jgi:hypothetical protein
MSFGVLHGLISSIASGNVRNPVTAARSDGVTPEAAPVLARTSVTPVTPLIVAAGTKGARLYRLTPEQADECHAGGWDDAEISAFVQRHARLLALGFGDGDANDVAERLTLRDRDGDDRRMCVECTWLGDTGRCLAAATGRIPGMDRRLEPVQSILQRCGAFGLRKGLV